MEDNRSYELSRFNKLFQDNATYHSHAEKHKRNQKKNLTDAIVLLNQEVAAFYTQKENLNKALSSIIAVYTKESNNQEFQESDKNKLKIIETFINNLDVLHNRIKSHATFLQSASNTEEITQFMDSLKLLNTCLKNACDTTIAYDIQSARFAWFIPQFTNSESSELIEIGVWAGVICAILVLILMINPFGLAALGGMAAVAAVIFPLLEAFGALGLLSFATAVSLWLTQDIIKKNAIDLKAENLNALAKASEKVEETVNNNDHSLISTSSNQTEPKQITIYKSFFSSSSGSSEEQPVEKNRFLTEQEAKVIQTKLANG